MKQHDECVDVYPGKYSQDGGISQNNEKMENDAPNEKLEPKVVVHEHESHKEVWIELPGIDKHEIGIKLQNRMMKVQASESDSKEIKRKYEARIRVPTHADSWFIHADYHSGLLKIKIPLNAEESPMLTRDIIIY